MILQAKDLRFSYSKKGAPVLEGVSLSLHSGERLGLWAPSGRGKTTLCRLLAGYERPTAGEVFLDGRPLSQYRGACPVQMIWQHPETVLDPLLPLEVSLKEAGPVEERLLEELHIQPQWLRRYPQELSGGELQRFCIARALGRATRYLLCDEITAMLDPIGRADVLRTIKTLNRERGVTVVLITHHMDEAAQADRLVVMAKGRVVADGAPKEVFQDVEGLKSVGITVPDTTELLWELRREGLDVPLDALSDEECAQALKELLCRVKSKE